MSAHDRKNYEIQVARYYYYGHLTQQEISGLLRTSRSDVVRTLQKARKGGVVQIHIDGCYTEPAELETALKEHFDLRDVTIVESVENTEKVKTAIGQSAAAALERYIRDNSRIGIAWGTTVDSFIRYYQPAKSRPHSVIAQMVGGEYDPELHLDPAGQVRVLAGKLQGGFSELRAPLYIQDEKRYAGLMSRPELRRHFRLLEQLDIALIGIGRSRGESPFRKSVSKKDRDEEGESSDWVCELCGHWIDENGEEAGRSAEGRIVGIPLGDLRRIPMVLALCTGGKKVRALRTAIRGGYVKGVITDDITAELLLQLEGVEV